MLPIRRRLGAALYDKPLLADTPAVHPRTGPGRVYAASVDSWIGSAIEGSSFSGLLTRGRNRPHAHQAASSPSLLSRGRSERALLLADLPQPLRGLSVLCVGARRPLLLVKEVSECHCATSPTRIHSPRR